MRTLSDQAVPLRDGHVLSADVYLPDAEAAVPALLTRTPYDGRRSVIAMAAIDLERATDAGFAVVVQDVRGRGRSDGLFTPFVLVERAALAALRADDTERQRLLRAAQRLFTEVGAAGRARALAPEL